jgi:hypothetical protein
MYYPRFRIVRDGEVLGEHWNLAILTNQVFSQQKESREGAIIEVQKSADSNWKPIQGQ